MKKGRLGVLFLFGGSFDADRMTVDLKGMRFDLNQRTLDLNQKVFDEDGMVFYLNKMTFYELILKNSDKLRRKRF